MHDFLNKILYLLERVTINSFNLHLPWPSSSAILDLKWMKMTWSGWQMGRKILLLLNSSMKMFVLKPFGLKKLKKISEMQNYALMLHGQLKGYIIQFGRCLFFAKITLFFLSFKTGNCVNSSFNWLKNTTWWFIGTTVINPYSGEIFLYKPWRSKGFFNLKSS